jgi:NAD(P)-dependent dehydrogenase (short-subunit alcohol dehydrogenase family)
MAEITNPFDFTGKVVLVTGSGSGLGRHIALRFSQAGASLAVHYRSSREGAESLASEIRGAHGRICVIQADLTREQEVGRMMEQVSRELGDMDVLINNAGDYPSSRLLDMSVAEWDQVLNANLRSTFLATRAAARQMVKAGRGGAIINIASIEGTFPAPGHGHYNAAKAGVLMLTRSSAWELGRHNIRVNSISPGLILREGIEQAWPVGVESWLKDVPLQRLGQPRDIADACLFLASSAADWITGANLMVDGGISARPAF